MKDRKEQIELLVNSLKDDEVREALKDIAFVMWPTTDINASDWDSDTLASVAQALFAYNLSPKD